MLAVFFFPNGVFVLNLKIKECILDIVMNLVNAIVTELKVEYCGMIKIHSGSMLVISW